MFSIRLVSKGLFAPLGFVALQQSSLLGGENKCAKSEAKEASSVTAARRMIVDIIDKSMEDRGDGTSIGPTLVRLAWHSAGTYAKADNSGGSDGGKMKYDPEASWGANAGLAEGRKLMEQVATETKLSRADAYTLGGVVAISEMGGPEISWRPGRSDAKDGSKSPPDGRLPNADMGSLRKTANHLRDIFYRMGFSDRDIVALSGAHVLGRCHQNASGYDGPWVYSETTFSNEYFRLLFDGTWTIKTTHKGEPWTGPDQFESADGELMMLPSDMALLWDKSFRAVAEEYAKDEEKFFADFARAFSKLLELGCSFENASAGGGTFLAKLRSKLGF
uniref:Cytochrome c peroxidase, mitochondrial n=1 Tax=Aureoumbra lagunensis TaxID=44058 RepID=A0A7S3K494_9STRA|mmetsp:Transcript_12833/g.17213  ORF Transcript_12833/g.17213 Transcript_12833/m.17213 type:complete len:333 (-) Transcript_12833:501-1499(-)